MNPYIRVKLEGSDLYDNPPESKKRSEALDWLENQVSDIITELDELGEDGCLSKKGLSILHKCQKIESAWQRGDESIVEWGLSEINNIVNDYNSLFENFSEVLNNIELINLTPHTITIIKDDEEIKLESKGLARVNTTTEVVDTVNGIPVNVVKFGSVTGLPSQQKDTMYIVSRIVAEAVKDERDDILIVDKTVRDGNGQIIGCTAFAKV